MSATAEHPAASMLEQWMRDTGVPAFLSGTIDGRSWQYLPTETPCAVCAQPILVGRVAVDPGAAVSRTASWAHVRCTVWRHERGCSGEHAMGKWHGKTNTALKRRGDIGKAPASAKTAAAAIDKLDPAACRRFRLVPADAVCESDPRSFAVIGYAARASVVADAPAPVAPPKRVRAPKVAQPTPAPVPVAVVTTPEVVAQPTPAPVLWFRSFGMEWSGARAQAHAWAAWAQRWADCVAIGAESRVPTVSDRRELASAIESDPDMRQLVELTPAQVRAQLWERVAAGLLSIDDAMIAMDATYAREQVSA